MALSLPVELWEYIAYHALAYEDNFLGSLIGITSLLLINKRLHSALSFPSCPRLYARLFCFKFDHAAPVRRLSSRWLAAPCLAAELRKRLLVLKRLREHERLEIDDLWTCYVMLLENDGRNERQLEWARLPETLLQNALFRYQTSPSNTVPWSMDYEATALIIWIGWYFTTPERLLSTPSQIRSLWSSVLLPEFILAGFKFPSVYAPDSFLHLPISTNVQTFPPTVSGPSPTLTAIVHYSLPLKLTAPVLTPAAVLSWAAIQETFQTLHPLGESTLSRFPPNRAAAIASNRTGPTVEDVLNFHQQRVVCPDRLSLPSHSTWNTYESVNSIPAKDDDRDESGECLNRSTRGSKEHDQDWYRIVSCFDIFALSRPLSGVVYPLGRLNGKWAGRYLFTDLHAHMDLLRSGARLDPKTTPIYTKPLYWTLQEHHCLKPSEGVFPGTDEYEGDDVLNAWLPRGFAVSELDDAIEISDPDNRVAVRYQTYYPDGSYRHAPSKADVSRPFTKWISEENADVGDRKDVSQDHRESYQEHVPSSISDSYIDSVSHRESGVADIVVTGETGVRHAQAWGDYKLVGRIRPWDGLIVLIQEPKNPTHTALGKSIFKGYIHGTNFVGRWRDTTTPAGLYFLQCLINVHQRSSADMPSLSPRNKIAYMIVLR